MSCLNCLRGHTDCNCSPWEEDWCSKHHSDTFVQMNRYQKFHYISLKELALFLASIRKDAYLYGRGEKPFMEFAPETLEDWENWLKENLSENGRLSIDRTAPKEYSHSFIVGGIIPTQVKESMKKQCITCKHFYIGDKPDHWNEGHVYCRKHDLICEYISKQKLKKLVCIEEEEENNDSSDQRRESKQV